MAYKDKATRNARLRAVYLERMNAIKAALGGICVLCGAGEPLHIDHKNGRNYTSRKISSYSRVIKYQEEMKAGNLRLLCEKCNCSSMNHPPGCSCGWSNQPHPQPVVAREPGDDDDLVQKKGEASTHD